jgi:acetate kinase
MTARPHDRIVLVLNGGSSSLRFALFGAGEPPQRLASGKVERIGEHGSELVARNDRGDTIDSRTIVAPDHVAAAQLVLDWAAAKLPAPPDAIGHRIVHGGSRFSAPCLITADILEELRTLAPYDPEHMPAELGVIEQVRARYPQVPQVACFDTAFHRSLPPVAAIYPLPRRYLAKGVRRYGFHGLSYTHLLDEIARLDGARRVPRRIVLTHLGNGASLAAVRDGVCIDTTMGFTPTGGIPMSTRSGDLDPGLVRWFAREERMDADEFHAMVNRESGLRGISETSSDVRDLLQREADDPRAAEALAVFCYQIRKNIGAFCAALGGLDLLVFAGGIGENAPAIRERICAGLAFLGLRIDEQRNAGNESLISADDSTVTARVIRTDEEIVIARAAFAELEKTRPEPARTGGSAA